MAAHLIENSDQLDEVEEMASLEHGRIGARLLRYLDEYVDQHKLGAVFDAQTVFKVVGNPPNRQPDVAFVTARRLPQNLRIKADFAPDLAVEVISETDKVFELEAKILQYLQSGVQLIWVIYPVSQTIEVYRAGDSRIARLGRQADLSGEDVIPGFQLKIENLFR